MSVTTLDGQTLTKRQARRAQRQGQMIVVQAPARPLWKRWWLSRLVGYGVVAVVAVVVLAWKSLFGAGRWRSLGWPVWVAGLAVAARSPWLWLAGALVLSCLPWVRQVLRRRRRVVSDREAYLWAGSFAVVGVLYLSTVVGVGFPWWVPAPFTVPTSVTWLVWRRTRKPSRFEVAWDAHVATTSEFKGVRLKDPKVKIDTDGQPDGVSLVVVPKGDTAKTIGKADDTLASHLAEAFPGMQSGSVVISHVPGDPIRTARLLVSNPRNLGKIRYWEEPTLDPKTGLWVHGHTGHERNLMRFWQPAGGLNTFCVAGPGKGKGGLTVLGGVEAALSPVVLPIVLDGKRGSGVPALRPGAALYARTPGEWIVAWEAAMNIMRARFEQYGEAGDSLFAPTPDEPLILVICDEWRYIHREWPQMIEDAVWFTGQSRSLGGHLWLNLHKGDAPGFGDAEIRSNGYSNGQVWVGPQGDIAAEGVAVQGWGVDPAVLPPYPGWGYACQTIDGDVGRTVRAKNLWIPTDAEVKKLGVPAPFETAEHHQRASAIFPTLQPAMQAILDTARELITSGRANDPATTADAREAAKAGLSRETTDDLILGALAAIGDAGAGATLLEEMGCGNRQWIQERLTAMSAAEPPLVVQDGPRKPYRIASKLETAS